MSGICGILRLDGSTPAAGQVEAMTAALARRGPDGSHHWQHGPVALGHALLATTPESLHETLPLTDPASGCSITADVRLDNRAELLPALGLADEARVIGDGELLLRAYLRWGEACLDHFLGDFAFAIWDPRCQRLFAARDPMGLRQLIHCHVPGKLFAFATEPEAILALSDVPRRNNEARIADYLDDLEAADFTSTFHEGLFRLPPAHCLSVDASGMTLRRYWTLRPVAELRLDSDEAYAAAFLEVFTAAVRSRLRCAGPVGSMLSGGMDSGSVVAVASRLLQDEGRGPLQTFSAVGPEPQACKETWAIHEAQGMPGLAPHSVSHAELEPFVEDLQRLAEEESEPFDGHMTLPRAAYLAAHRAGIKVMLDGVGGDVVLGAGNLIPRLLRRGQWRQAWREIKGERYFWGGFEPLPWQALRHLRSALTPNLVRRFRHRLRQWRDRLRPVQGRLVNPDLARRVNLTARHAGFRNLFRVGWRDPAVERVDGMSHIYLTVGRERYDRVGAALAIEPRDPFMDLRLVNFCLSLPASQLQSDGWPKMILRRAMAGLLPDSVRWRTGKEHLGWAFTVALLQARPASFRSLAQSPALLRPLVSPKGLEELASGVTENQDYVSLYFLGLWLRSQPTDKNQR
jgi:asparagine synthase (glutamine-hydrolysing)